MPERVTTILGVDVDSEGRCVHYHQLVDVVANRCATCDEYWACHACHEALADHEFGRIAPGQPAVMCGACGIVMDQLGYQSQHSCPGCGHPFNPRCALHADRYFRS